MLAEQTQIAINISTSILTLTVVFGLLFSTLLQPNRERLNWLLALFLVTLGSWSFFTLSRHLEGLRDYVDSRVTFYLLLTALGYTSLTFYIFVAHYCRWNRGVVKALNRLLPLALILMTVLLWTDSVVDYRQGSDGELINGDSFDVLPLGYIGLSIIVLYSVVVYILLRRNPTEKSKHLEVPALLLIVGYSGNFIGPLSILPFDSLMATFAALLIGQAVMRYQLFTPLKITNEKLQLANQELRNTTYELKAQKAQVEKLNEELRLASRYKSEFLANMSHELRTPLNSIVGYSELLIQGTYGVLNDKQQDRVEKIHRNGHTLLDLISDILDLSKIEAGKLEIAPEQLQLSGVLNELLPSIEPMAQKKHLQLEISLARDIHLLYADPLRLRQILLNLLSNAIKFTAKGSVSLKAYNIEVLKAQSSDFKLPAIGWLRDGIWVLIEVVDTGIGIAPEKQALVFEAFQQADGTTTRQYGGTGLGLAITRRLVELHDGRIWMKSTPNQGTTFFVALPASVNPLMPATSPALGVNSPAQR